MILRCKMVLLFNFLCCLVSNGETSDTAVTTAAGGSVTVSNGMSVLPSMSSSENSPPTQGGTQIYQPPPTAPDGPASCFYFDSRTNTSRLCSLNRGSSCFSFIRRVISGPGAGGFRVKRGCSANCQEERRPRKIQICCSSHLCNNHALSAADFSTTTSIISTTTSTAAPTPISMTRTPPTTHTPSTTPTFISSSPTPPLTSDTPPTTSLFIPPNLIPSKRPSTDPPNPPTPQPLLRCHCNTCGPLQECKGHFCGTQITHGLRSTDIDLSLVCVNDTSSCTSAPNPSPEPGTTNLICCNLLFCNQIPARPTTMQTTPTITTPPQTTLSVDETSHGIIKTTVSTSTSATPSTSSGPPPPPQSSTDQHFKVATALSVLCGVIAVGIILAVLIVLIRHHRKKIKEPSDAKLSQQPPSPDYHMTTCCPTATDIKGSPSPSNSMTTSSDSSGAGVHVLKHLGTSV